MIYATKIKEEMKDVEELDDLQSNAKQVRSVEISGKLGYHYDINELFETITKAVTDGHQNLPKETKSTTKADMELDESKKYIKTLESLNKNEVISSSFIRPLAKLLVPKNKSQFRLKDDPDSDNWKVYKKNCEKVTFYNDKLLFRDSGVVFTLQGDILSTITGYDFKKSHSPDAKQIINFLKEMHFNTRATGKSNRHKNLIKNYYNTRAILASELKIIFLSGNPNELCERLKLLIQEKRADNDSGMTNQEMVAIIDELLEYKNFTPTQHKKIYKKFSSYKENVNDHDKKHVFFLPIKV